MPKKAPGELPGDDGGGVSSSGPDSASERAREQQQRPGGHERPAASSPPLVIVAPGAEGGEPAEAMAYATFVQRKSRELEARRREAARLNERLRQSELEALSAEAELENERDELVRVRGVMERQAQTIIPELRAQLALTQAIAEETAGY
eukprot:gene216-104_t